MLKNPQKPFYDEPSEILELDSFNVQKNYVFNVMKRYVDEIVGLNSGKGSPVRLLDAACQNLLARHIFPNGPEFQYFGLDYDRARFVNWQVRAKSPTDRVFLADLTREVVSPPGFDLVVSSNTLSHIPIEYWRATLKSLCNYVLPGGSLFINFPLSKGWENIVSQFEGDFQTSDLVYYTSNTSLAIGAQFPGVRLPNIQALTWQHEASLRNDVTGHNQALVAFRHKSVDDFLRRTSLSIFDDAEIIHEFTGLRVPEKIVINGVEQFWNVLVPKLSGGKVVLVGPRHLQQALLLFARRSVSALNVAVVPVFQSYEDLEVVDFEVIKSFDAVVFYGLERKNLPTSDEQRDARLFINRAKIEVSESTRLIMIVSKTWLGEDTSVFTDIVRFA